jgi:hypothetical protein
MGILPHYLADVPHHYWDARLQAFVADIKADGVIVQRYTIPRAVFFAIHADMARAIQDCFAAEEAALVVRLKPKRRRKH